MITILTLASEHCSSRSGRNADRRRYKCGNCIIGESHPYLCRHCVLGREDAAFSCRRCSIGTVTPQWTAADTPFNCRGCRSKKLKYGDIQTAAEQIFVYEADL